MKVIVQDFSRDPLSAKNWVCEFEGREEQNGPLKGWYRIEKLQFLEERPQNTADLPVLHSGFVDAHLHLSWMGEQRASLRTTQFLNPVELKNALAKRFQNGSTQVEIAYGYDEVHWPGANAQAIADTLNGLPSGSPWILFRICGHKALASAEVLRRAGWSKSDRATWLDGEDVFRLYRWLEQTRKPFVPIYLLRAQDELLRMGYSAVSDMAWDSAKAESVLNLHNDMRLMLDVAGVLLAGSAPEIENEGPFYKCHELAHPVLQEHTVITCRHWKKFLDGSLGARTALLTEAYADQKDEYGKDLHDVRDLIGQAEAALSKGFHLSFHAIGDGAIDRVIEVQEMLQNLLSSRRRLSIQNGLPAVWHRIEHGQVLRDEQLHLLRESKNWMICAQPFHRIMDESFIGSRLGLERTEKNAYRLGSVLGAGLPIVLSSDGPIGSISPAEVMTAVMKDPRHAERADFLQLMWIFTRGARAFLGLPDRSLAKGKWAWLSQNPAL